MAKLKRRRSASRALENRQMFAADLFQVFVPLDEAGINEQYQELLGEGLDGQSVGGNNLSGTLNSIVRITVLQDDTELFYDFANDGYDADAVNPIDGTSSTVVYGAGGTLNAGDVIELSGSSYGSGDRISATNAISVTRLVDDTGFLGATEAALVSVNPDVNVGEGFSLALLNEGLTDRNGDLILRDSGVFLSAYSDSALVYITDTNGLTGLLTGTAMLEGEQLFFSDADLQAAAIEDVSNPGTFLSLANGWRSVTAITTDTDEQISAVLASGNSDLGTTYFVSLVSDESHSDSYFLPIRDPSTANDGQLDNNDVVYVVKADLATTLTITRANGSFTQELAAGETYSFQDQNSAVRISSSSSPIAVYGLQPGGFERTEVRYTYPNGIRTPYDYIYPTYYSSGWAFEATPEEYLAPEVFLRNYSGLNYWITVSEATTLSVSDSSSFYVIPYGGGYPVIESVLDDTTGDIYRTFRAAANVAYRFTAAPNGDSDTIRISSAGNALISVVAASAVGTDAYGFAETLPSSGTLSVHREFYETSAALNDGNNYVELGEEAWVRASVINNSGSAIVVDADGYLNFMDDLDTLNLTSAYTLSGDSIVTIRLLDSNGDVVIDGGIALEIGDQSLAALRAAGGVDLRELFAGLFTDPETFELNFADGYRIEVIYPITISATLNQDIVDDDYAILGRSSLSYLASDGSEGSVDIKVPLVIEVPETPSFTLDPKTVSEDAADPIIYISLGTDTTGEYLSGTDASTEIKLRSTWVNTSTYATLFANSAVNNDFTLVGLYGTLTVNTTETENTLSSGKIALNYVKSLDEYNQSDASQGVLEDGFAAEVRNDYFKYGRTSNTIRITDTGIQGSVTSLDGVAIDPSITRLTEDETAALTGNIVDQYPGLTAYDSGDFRVGYINYQYLSGSNTVNGDQYISTDTTVTLRYGTLTIAPDGTYSYRVLPDRLQFLAEGESVNEVVGFRIGDSDYSTTNNQRYLSQTLNFRIYGNQDIQVVADLAELALSIPENGGLYDQRLVIQASSGLNQLIIDVDGTTDGLGQTFLFDEINLLSVNGVESVPATDPVSYTVPPEPIIVDTGLGILTISEFSYAADGDSATLVYSYVPKANGLTGPVSDQFGFIIQDQNLESLAYDFNLNLIPPITENGPSLSVDDQNGAVSGDYTVIENSDSPRWNEDQTAWEGIILHVEPSDNWRSVLINGVVVVEQGRFFDDADPDNVFSTIGRQIVGSYGTLTMRGGDKSAGELYLSYESRGDLGYDPDGDSQNHSAGLLLDRFSVVAIDLLNNAGVTDIEVLVGDTYPQTEWDRYGDAKDGVLTEDDNVTEFSANVSINDTPSLDRPNQIIGIKSLDINGGGLFEFGSPDSVFIAREDGGLGVSGLYGTLWMARDGSFTYVLDNSRTATQALTEDKPGVEQFAYTLADADSDPNNNPAGRNAARLFIHINGMPDPDPEIGENGTNSDLPIPENGGVSNQRLNIATTDALATLAVNGVSFTPERLLQSSETSPLAVPGSCGTFYITGFDPDTGQLVYGYVPFGGATSRGCESECVPLTVTDTFGESATIQLCFTLTPPRVSDVPPITTTELLATDGSRSLVRPVYQQQIGLASVQQTSIELTDPSYYIGGDFEVSPFVDDRRLSPLEPYEPEEYALLVQRDIPPQLLSVESRLIDYVVPSDTFLHTDAQARISLSVTLVDGSNLPDWLEFDPNTARFTGLAPIDVSGEFLIKIVARDEDGRQAETIMRLIVEEPVAQGSAGRASFSQQIAQQQSAALIEESPDAG